MTEGRDGADERSADEGSADSRDHEDSFQTEWEQPWPDDQHTVRDSSSPDDQTGNSPVTENDPRHTDETDTRTEIESERAGQTRRRRGHSERVSPGAGTETEPTEQVYVAEQARPDEGWVDLGEQRPEGEVLGPGTLSEEELLEYITDERSLHPLVQVQWGIRITIGVFIIGLITSWAFPTLGINQLWAGALVGGLLLLGLVWIVLYYRLWMYQIRADAIYLERGVLTHVRSLVPYVRIQHVDTSQSIIERWLGLSTLVVYTAGSRGADVSIPGLLPDEARDLQRRVKELAIEAEGDDAL